MTVVDFGCSDDAANRNLKKAVIIALLTSAGCMMPPGELARAEGRAGVLLISS